MSIVEAPPVETTIDLPVVDPLEAERREILLRAAELIEIDGWTYGTDGMKTSGPHCMLGAVAHAMGSRSYQSVDGRILYAHDPPSSLIGINWIDITRWNDTLQIRPINIAESHWWRRRVRFGVRNPGATTATALRRLANGATWDEATYVD